MYMKTDNIGICVARFTELRKYWQEELDLKDRMGSAIACMMPYYVEIVNIWRDMDGEPHLTLHIDGISYEMRLARFMELYADKDRVSRKRFMKDWIVDMINSDKFIDGIWDDKYARIWMLPSSVTSFKWVRDGHNEAFFSFFMDGREYTVTPSEFVDIFMDAGRRGCCTLNEFMRRPDDDELRGRLCDMDKKAML